MMLWGWTAAAQQDGSVVPSAPIYPLLCLLFLESRETTLDCFDRPIKNRPLPCGDESNSPQHSEDSPCART